MDRNPISVIKINLIWCATANDPAFARTRENGSEFGRAGKGGKLLRIALRILLQNASDKRVTSRLTKDLLAIIKTDATNARGLRTLTDGTIALLLGFEFNLNGKLGTTLFAPFVKAFDRVTGDATLNLAAFSPTLRIAAPTGTTHFKVVMGAAELDFVNEASVFENDETAILPYTAADTAAIELTASLKASCIVLS